MRHGQPDQRRNHGQIDKPALPRDRPPRGGQEDPVVQGHHGHGRGHHLLGSHAQPEGGHRHRIPPFCGLRAAQDAVQADEIEQPHQRLKSLHHVRHRRRLQGMDQPDGGHGHGQIRSRSAVASSQGIQQQCPPHEIKQHQGRHEVDRQIHQVIGLDLESVTRPGPGQTVAESQRQMPDRPRADQA